MVDSSLFLALKQLVFLKMNFLKWVFKDFNNLLDYSLVLDINISIRSPKIYRVCIINTILSWYTIS